MIAMVAVAAPTNASNDQIILSSFDRLNEHDTPALRPFWTTDTVEHFPDRTCRGGDEIAAYFEAMFAAMPDWHVDVEAIAAQGEHVFVQWHLTATHRGRLLGIAPTGKRIEIDGIDHFVMRDGKVVSNFVVADQMDYARQIGMMPPDGSILDRTLKALFNARTAMLEKLKR